LFSEDAERKEAISRIMNSFQLKDVVYGIKEKKIANKLIPEGHQAEIKKIVAAMPRDPRRLIT
jgi:hypothetical protein